MAIKKLQNNFTTPEQSKRLLELGVPADSADLYTSLGFENLTWIRNTKNELSKDFFDALINGKSANIPIWSVGRLIEIISICGSLNRVKIFRLDKTADIYRSAESSVVDMAIDDIETLIKSEDIDFSKLEE